MGVVSASHDQTLKVWTFEGECISELVGHTALVYSVACTEEGIIASGSEDNTLRLWRADGTCLQVRPEWAGLAAVLGRVPGKTGLEPSVGHKAWDGR